MEDDDLIKRVANGEQEAFAELYQLKADHALRTAIAITQNKEIAKDAVQETFFRVYQRLDSFDQRLTFDPWFYRILVNECRRLLKKETRFLDRLKKKTLDTNIQMNEAKPDYSLLYEAMQRLPEINRIPIILKYVKGFSEMEIAEILGANQNTIKSRLYKGRNKLRNLMEKRGRE
ncbi:RNA polymerase sigma factor [Alkalicoccobacillus plakortidis]|uniref:Sigma-70 family RNA polymerase sigma factor n=1 Tax=Alkalicoccobacillus plakortidis TaxID=444060 RepID=A0ABT0XGR9_9BACI|nr:sigma-70 family RNA polymerase sigma factor [Alkalicoccobacillus plakortidis]MCM2675086.1 sigma-70 family RNA polymerase sigma factor [Alkalicoccobacillus plakortidis]